MKTFFDCIPCFVRQSLDAIRMITPDEAVHEQVLREVLRVLAEMDLCQSPPVIAQRIHRLIGVLTGERDPYRQVKDRFNRLALKMYPRLRAGIDESPAPLETAVRLAIAGNVIDMGVNNDLTDAEVHNSVEGALTKALNGQLAVFDRAISSARDILYLTDNAGEIVFDRLLIEQMSPERVTVAVKGAPIINDATMADATAAGLDDLVNVIDNGSDAPGTILEDCSATFREYFDKADMIIAKGQGNYETLSEVDKNIFFVLKAKCPVIARDLGCEVGDFVLRRSNRGRAA
ncbi:MAG: DUF89 family protein [Planctomycetes bacterium]|nr:DUF89 family protein [Planctomycetota bacterium]